METQQLPQIKAHASYISNQGRDQAVPIRFSAFESIGINHTVGQVAVVGSFVIVLGTLGLVGWKFLQELRRG